MKLFLRVAMRSKHGGTSSERNRLSPSHLTSLFVLMAPWLSGRALLGL